MKTSIKSVLLIVSMLSLGGCASTQSDRSILDRLEFDENECGAFELEGNIKVGGNPFVNNDVHVKLEKQKQCEGEQ